MWQDGETTDVDDDTEVCTPQLASKTRVSTVGELVQVVCEFVNELEGGGGFGVESEVKQQKTETGTAPGGSGPDVDKLMGVSLRWSARPAKHVRHWVDDYLRKKTRMSDEEKGEEEEGDHRVGVLVAFLTWCRLFMPRAARIPALQHMMVHVSTHLSTSVTPVERAAHVFLHAWGALASCGMRAALRHILWLVQIVRPHVQYYIASLIGGGFCCRQCYHSQYWRYLHHFDACVDYDVIEGDTSDDEDQTAMISQPPSPWLALTRHPHSRSSLFVSEPSTDTSTGTGTDSDSDSDSEEPEDTSEGTMGTGAMEAPATPGTSGDLISVLVSHDSSESDISEYTNDPSTDPEPKYSNDQPFYVHSAVMEYLRRFW
jgi:hypothetical protein